MFFECTSFVTAKKRVLHPCSVILLPCEAFKALGVYERETSHAVMMGKCFTLPPCPLSIQPHEPTYIYIYIYIYIYRERERERERERDMLADVPSKTYINLTAIICITLFLLIRSTTLFLTNYASINILPILMVISSSTPCFVSLPPKSPHG